MKDFLKALVSVIYKKLINIKIFKIDYMCFLNDNIVKKCLFCYIF